ncbi:acyl-CoA dehydrogenase family protein [Roseomonas populi]|uniref:Acyl-CoA/acyl-ACP dehydrogenase n=1 Tax=Roseomonas populi TaxID=3121582 RepID=A0ABT1XA55_9PROT|nr:acyl-CoA dehydrogenase family protein [Roseomonas pecuniae]MCR0983869.1 acyl-CoA/acyl-ACP dehydrogenase [Roseomonas pecuniae]
MAISLDPALRSWLDEAATGLDRGTADPASVLPRLAAAGVFRIGVPEELGGTGGDVTDAVEAVAAISERSLAAGFVAWGHRTFIEYLLQSPNDALRDRLLPALLAGEVAGATGMSNAMKALAGLEEIGIAARQEGERQVLDGRLPWVTNLRAQGFHVAAAVAPLEGGEPFCVSLPSDAHGLQRSDDLDLLAMRSTSTAAVDIRAVPVGPENVLHPNAGHWLPRVRPAFLGLQCGMSIGLARRALAEAAACGGAARHVLLEPVARLTADLSAQQRALFEGLQDGRFVADAPSLFRIRIALAEIVAEATGLELQASGGRAYLTVPGEGFARRWREAAFIPVITPSLVQLRAALAGQAARAA